MSEGAAIQILVVEDEKAIRNGLCDVLAYNGYSPEGVERGDDGLRRALEVDFGLAILDVMLPGLNGFEICEQLRAARPKQPILMLTARGAEQDIVKGFRCGSDDYVTKPFSVAELMLRVEALLRRSGALEEPGASARSFDFGEWHVDGEGLRASRADDSVELNRRDVEILALFHEERGRIVSRRRLLSEVWGYGSPERVETRSIDMHIAKLRKKLDVRGGVLIETVRGEGYRFSG